MASSDREEIDKLLAPLSRVDSPKNLQKKPRTVDAKGFLRSPKGETMMARENHHHCLTTTLSGLINRTEGSPTEEALDGYRASV